MNVTRSALAGMTVCMVAVSLYALTRGAQVLFGHEPDPAAVLWSGHSGYFWRALTSLYVGGMAALLGYGAAARHARLLGRALLKALAVTTALLVAEALFAP